MRRKFSDFFICRRCGKELPRVIEKKDTRECVPCFRKHLRRRVAKYRARLKVEDPERYREYTKTVMPRYRKRCLDMWYRANQAGAIPVWETQENLLPLYKRAQELNEQFPQYVHEVRHIYGIKSWSDGVCGLHTVANLRITRRKKISPVQ